MNTTDQAIARNEREASQIITSAQPSHIPRQSHEIEHIPRASSSSSDLSRPPTTSHIDNLGRADTQRDLERHPIVLSRLHTAKSQHSETVGHSLRSLSRDRGRPLPGMGLGKAYPPLLPDSEDYVVEFDGPDDPLHAQNWPLKKKLLVAVMLGFSTMTSAFTSSIFSTVTKQVALQYRTSSIVSVLGLTLYVLGYAFGPIFWAPFSELRGRKLPLVWSMLGFSIFQIGVAAAKDIQTVLLCRFWGGMFGAAPVAVVPAVFSDIFDNRTRGLAISVFSLTVFAGPLLAPFIGGFIVQSSLGWRWTEWLVAILGFASFLINLFFLEETYPPVILIEKAAELRRRTGNWGIHAKQEEIEIDLQELISKNFSRPLRLLFFEPIVLLVSIHSAFTYGLLYLFLTAYPIVFQGIYGMSPGIGGFPYFGLIAGMSLAVLYVIFTQSSYNRKCSANDGVSVPEWRLPQAIIGGVVFGIGLLWFGWSGYKSSIHWIIPTLSGLFTGFGILSIFVQYINYLVDAYLMFAASALAASSLLRSLAGAGFPLFSLYLFDGLGVNWAGTILGCIALVLVPVPIAFYYYGPLIRAKSSFAHQTNSFTE